MTWNLTASKPITVALVYTVTTPELKADVVREIREQVGADAKLLTYEVPEAFEEIKRTGRVTARPTAQIIGCYMRAIEEGADVILSICSTVEDIAYWEIDDDYNGEQFVVRGLHFCGGSKKEFEAWRKGLQSVAPGKNKKGIEKTLRIVFNEEMWDTLYDFRSHPIEKRAGHKIAVRVISQFGEESTKVLTI